MESKHFAHMVLQRKEAYGKYSLLAVKMEYKFKLFLKKITLQKQGQCSIKINMKDMLNDLESLTKIWWHWATNQGCFSS